MTRSQKTALALSRLEWAIESGRHDISASRIRPRRLVPLKVNYHSQMEIIHLIFYLSLQPKVFLVISLFDDKIWQMTIMLSKCRRNRPREPVDIIYVSIIASRPDAPLTLPKLYLNFQGLFRIGLVYSTFLGMSLFNSYHFIAKPAPQKKPSKNKNSQVEGKP